jgi:ABC-type lipoprotein release transport system permease subunit
VTVKYLLIAARNLLRNVRRTLLTLAAIAFGLALMIAANNLQAGQHDDLRRTAISTMAGDVVLDRIGYRDDAEAHETVPHADVLAARLAAAFPGATVTRRILLPGLLTSPTSSVGASLGGIDPVAEAAVQEIATKVVEGSWLGDDPRGIVIGVRMAESLGVKLGDKLVFMGQYETDEVQSRLFRVQGIFRTGAADVDAFTAWTTLEPARELTLQPDTANQLAVHLPGGSDAKAAAARARVIANEVLGADAPDIEVLDWEAALPELWSLLALDRKGNDVTMGMLAIIVAMGVLNTVLMSVLERTREFGVLLAIGMRPWRLGALVLLEGFVLGAIGGALGVALGTALSYPLVVYGLDYTEVLGETFETAGVNVSALLHARYDWNRAAVYYAASILMTIASALYPAVQVLRLTPVEAMRKV